MKNPLLSAFEGPTPTADEIGASSQRVVFVAFAAIVMVLAPIYLIGHALAGIHFYAVLLGLILASALCLSVWVAKTRRFGTALRLLTGIVSALLVVSVLGQGPGLPSAAWWLAVMPYLLASAGLPYMALGMVGMFLGAVTYLFAGGPVPFGLPIDDAVGDFRRYAAVAGSELIALFVIVLSMIRRTQVARALDAARIDALEAAAIKTRFFANMSHEIRAPLTGIVGVADVLDSPNLPDAQRRQLIGLQRQSASTLLALVNDILDASKLDAGKLVIEAVPLDLRLLVFEVNELFAMQAFGKGLELTSSVSPNLPLSFVGDPVRVRQIVTNLVSNAVKFTQHGGVHIHVSLDSEGTGAPPTRSAAGGRCVRIEVTDSGPGIAADRLALLFRPFVQADETVTRRYGGTGLGLSISSELCRLMGGSIDVRSSLGAGSTFIVRLPLRVDVDLGPTSVPQRRPDVVLASACEGLERHVRALLAELRIDPAVVRRLPADGELRECRHLLVDAALFNAPEAQRWLEQERAAGRNVLVLAPLGADAIAGGLDSGLIVYKPVSRAALEEGLRAGTSSTPARADVEPAARPIAGTRVLVAEDNPVNQIVVKEMLATLGIEPTIVGDGRGALEALAQQTFDLVLMDVDMPTMNGLDATRQIRMIESSTGRRRVHVLAMTAASEGEDGPTCATAGMDGFLAKPFSIVQLQTTLQRAFSLVGAPSISATRTD